MMLELIIEKKRKRMIYLAGEYGFTSPKTIQCSQELDKLLNIHRERGESIPKKYMRFYYKRYNLQTTPVNAKVVGEKKC